MQEIDKMAPSLLSIPLEIRLQIINHAIKEAICCPTHPGASLAHNKPGKIPNTKLELALTCHQLYNEVFSTERGKTTLDFCSLKCLVDDLDAATYARYGRHVDRLCYEDKIMVLRYISSPRLTGDLARGRDCGTLFVQCSKELIMDVCSYLEKHGQEGSRLFRMAFFDESNKFVQVFSQSTMRGYAKSSKEVYEPADMGDSMWKLVTEGLMAMTVS